MGAWGHMGIFSFQMTKPMPCIEGGMGMYQTRDYFERASAFGEYNDPVKFPKESPVHAYEGTGFGNRLLVNAMCRFHWSRIAAKSNGRRPCVTLTKAATV